MDKQNKKKQQVSMYVVINKNGMVFAGMRNGYFRWSHDWNEAKPLYRENTTLLAHEYPELELIKEEDF